MTTRRIKTLKDNLINTAPEISVERALLITESYKKTKKFPMIIRRAKALEYILNNMAIYMVPDELIVGNQAHKQRAAPIFPEYDVDYLEREMDEFEKRSGDAFIFNIESTGALPVERMVLEAVHILDRIFKDFSKQLKGIKE